ncbi:DUF1870 family protein [Pragia fontium]|uniref:DUF1870 domain-containing protein n=1 Tax=Pragia fontium DSM 5563 = ATCC 49100 TaxID=1122977 RepID=A0AAJ4W9G2_9GAMM|nr:DUF1870 family protein [Pragia fontium]SFC49197.1 protein of unknown function [Pragia fontium DSM 5563 = ATCC 49100]
MNNFELKQLRKLLFLSPSEAAEEIGNVETRTWQRWEKGERAIPLDVISKIQMLALTRQERLSVEPDSNDYNYQYIELFDDFINVSGVKSIVKWRLAQSVAAQLLLERESEAWRMEEIIQDEG